MSTSRKTLLDPNRQHRSVGINDTAGDDQVSAALAEVAAAGGVSPADAQPGNSSLNQSERRPGVQANSSADPQQQQQFSQDPNIFGVKMEMSASAESQFLGAPILDRHRDTSAPASGVQTPATPTSGSSIYSQMVHGGATSSDAGLRQPTSQPTILQSSTSSGTLAQDPASGSGQQQLGDLAGINVNQGIAAHPVMLGATGNGSGSAQGVAESTQNTSESLAFNSQLQHVSFMDSDGPQGNRQSGSTAQQSQQQDDPSFPNFFVSAAQSSVAAAAAAGVPHPQPLQHTMSTGRPQIQQMDISNRGTAATTSQTQPSTPSHSHTNSDDFDQQSNHFVFQPPTQPPPQSQLESTPKTYAGSRSSSGSNSNPGSPRGSRRTRSGWTESETMYLMDGCRVHGVGNWKKILNDERYDFQGRTAVDLKDRFRTSFPEEYSRLYPNAKTHKAKRSSTGSGFTDASLHLVKINRKERRFFSEEEDARLLEGFLKHGPAWAKIQSDPDMGLAGRRSTDLRDRFRNAYPNRYIAAGYKGRSSSTRRVYKQQRGGLSRQNSGVYTGHGDTRLEREQMQAEYKVVKSQNDMKFGKPGSGVASQVQQTSNSSDSSQPQTQFVQVNQQQQQQQQQQQRQSIIDAQFATAPPPGQGEELDMSSHMQFRMLPSGVMGQIPRQQLQPPVQILGNQHQHAPPPLLTQEQLQQQQVGVGPDGMFHPMAGGQMPLSGQMSFPMQMYYAPNNVNYRHPAHLSTQSPPPQSGS